MMQLPIREPKTIRCFGFNQISRRGTESHMSSGRTKKEKKLGLQASSKRLASSQFNTDTDNNDLFDFDVLYNLDYLSNRMQSSICEVPSHVN